jgi:hypothetical protein
LTPPVAPIGVLLVTGKHADNIDAAINAAATRIPLMALPTKDHDK